MGVPLNHTPATDAAAGFFLIAASITNSPLSNKLFEFKGFEMQEKRQPSAGRSILQRSAVTNGKRLFVEGGDGRSPWARRWRDLVELHAGDLGGADILSEAQLALCRRAATLSIELERIEGALSAGSEADMDLYGRLAGHQRRILETLGIERQHDLVPTLAEYLAVKAAAADERQPD